MKSGLKLELAAKLLESESVLMACRARLLLDDFDNAQALLVTARLQLTALPNIDTVAADAEVEIAVAGSTEQSA
jgi:hypothetical protein